MEQSITPLIAFFASIGLCTTTIFGIYAIGAIVFFVKDLVQAIRSK